MQNTQQIWRLVDDKAEAFEKLSDRVFDTPEIAYTDHKSVAEHRAELERQGFRITEDLGNRPKPGGGRAWPEAGQAGERRDAVAGW